MLTSLFSRQKWQFLRTEAATTLVWRSYRPDSAVTIISTRYSSVLIRYN